MHEFDLGVLADGGLSPIPYPDALNRVSAYIGEPKSGWATYDLPAVHARREGQFDSVGPWSLLLANTLSGRVDQSNVASFDSGLRRDFASRVAAVPDTTPLADMSETEIDAVVHLASFGYSGVWGPKTTKLAALYRPLAVPVLDSQMARAFGLVRAAFSAGRQRRTNIGAVTHKLAAWQGDEQNASLLGRLRADVGQLAPEVHLISDVRLLDIVVWTSQDDRFSRRSGKKQMWVKMAPGAPVTLDSTASVPIPRRQPSADTSRQHRPEG